MLSFDWDNFAALMLPTRRRLPKFRAWLQVLLHPLRQLHSQFITYADDVYYRIAITSQIIYLEKLLNDKFNQGLPARATSSNAGLYNGAPTGIYISYPADVIYPLYLWNKAEQRPITRLYNKWNSATHYHVGDYVVYDKKVYIALLNNVNYSPAASPPKWFLHAERTYLRNKTEIDGQYDFIVNIPTACGDVTDPVFAAKVTAQINVYVIAGRKFQLVNY